MIDCIWNWDELLLPYHQAVRELCVKFEAYTKHYSGSEPHAPVESVEGRVKCIGSIMEKAIRKNLDYRHFNTLSEQMEDIAGVRVICRFTEDIERVAALVRARTDMRVTAERDYVNKTKPSGYRSYHMHVRYGLLLPDGPRDVLAEIQIRTLAMNFWAIIEHSLKYKYKGNLPEPLQKRLFKSAEAAFLLDNEMSTIRDEIIEAQRIVERRNDVVDRILRNIKSLYRSSRLEDMDALNKEFLSLNEEGDVEKLQLFNQRLRTLAQLNQVEHC